MRIAAVLVYSALAIWMLLEAAPIQYYAYAFFPILFWAEVAQHLQVLFPLLSKSSPSPSSSFSLGRVLGKLTGLLFVLAMIEIHVSVIIITSKKKKTLSIS